MLLLGLVAVQGDGPLLKEGVLAVLPVVQEQVQAQALLLVLGGRLQGVGHDGAGLMEPDFLPARLPSSSMVSNFRY